MSNSEVSLKWNGFETNMLNSLKCAFRNEDFADVALVCEGISVKSHKVVLSACSPLFKNIFNQNPHPFTVIILQDVSLFNLKALLAFIYNGEVNVTQDRLSELLKAAENLKIRGLTTVSEDVDEPVPSKQKVFEFSAFDSNEKPAQNDLQNNVQPETANLGELIPKEEPPDLICVEAILNDGYADENNTACDNFDQAFFMQHDLEANQTNVDDTQHIVAKQIALKSGKIKKKKSKTKKKHNAHSQRMISCRKTIVESGKENMITDEETEKDIGLQSGVVLEAFTNGTVCEDESKNEHTKMNVEYTSPKFPCPFCSRIYHTWGYRRRHVKSRHRVNRLTCRMCEVQTTSQTSWFEHVVQRHAMGKGEARDGLVILVEAHAVLTCTSPPSPTYLINDFQKEQDSVEEPLGF